jgi:hypothetical protein
MVWRLLMGGVFVSLLAAAAAAQPAGNDEESAAGAAVDASVQANASEKQLPPAETYEQIIKGYEQARVDFFSKYRTAKTDEERQKLAADYPRPDKYAEQALSLAKENLEDDFAVKALVWAAMNASGGPVGNEAIELIQENFVESKELGSLCARLVYVRTPAAKKLLDAVLEKNPHREVQAQACLAMANAAMPRGEGSTEKAEALFQQLADKYGDVKAYRGTMGEMAERYLFELRNLTIGKVAPEIEGEDLDGEHFKLSDYRGKVVVLDFWGNW